MDAYESDRASETPKPPSNHAERNDETSHLPRNRELCVRSKSPTPTRFPSSQTTGTSTISASTPKRAVSAENTRPSTAGHSTFAYMELARKIGSKLTESLWPSRTRTLNAPFPSDTSSMPVAKREILSHEDISDCTIKTSLNVEDKQTAMLPVSSKPTPESERTPLKGKNVIDPSENLKPPDGPHVRLVNQHRWPSITGSNVLNKNINPPDESMKTCNTPDTSVRAPHLRRTSLPNYASKPLQESSSDATSLLSSSLADNGRLKIDKLQKIPASLADDGRLEYDKLQRISNLVSGTSHHRSHLLPTTESEPSSPNKSYGLASRDVSPLRTRTLTPAPATGVSPSLTVTRVSPSPASRGATLAPFKGVNPSHIVRGVSLTPATRGVSLTPATRGVSLTPAIRRLDPSSDTRDVGPSPTTREVSPSPITRGVDPSPAARVVALAPSVRGVSPMTPEREVSPTPTARSVSPPPDSHTPIRPSSPRQSCNPNTVSILTEIGLSPAKGIGLTPTREVSPSPIVRGVSPTPSRGVSHSLTARGVSPTPVARGISSSPFGRAVNPTHATRGVRPTPIRPSPARGIIPSLARGVGPRATSVSLTPIRPFGPRRSCKSNTVSMFTEIADSRKDNNVANHIEDAQYLELLYNIQVQWQFVNASAEAALDLHKVTAEKSFFDVWRTTLVLRDSVAAKKIDIDLLILQLKLYAVLYRQMAYIDGWASIQREHESALSGTAKNLLARTLRVPITGGAKADIKTLKLVVCSTVQVMQTTVSSIQSTLSKLDRTHFLASELATAASHERALLDECKVFLTSAAPIQVEECSLRTHLIQSNQACKSE